jgi:ketosteroid isomerase-like protein
MKRFWLAAILLLPAVVLVGAPAAAQKGKKKDDKTAQNAAAAAPLPVPTDQAIDTAISEMLAGWQLGDIEMMHKHYADNVMVVSGAWEPALVGWDKYVAAYKAQRARMEGPALERSNTFISGSGNVAWATYQWDFRAAVDGQPAAARGQTTLVFEKRNGVWLIVVNHTSLVSEAQPKTPTPNPSVPKP